MTFLYKTSNINKVFSIQKQKSGCVLQSREKGKELKKTEDKR